MSYERTSSSYLQDKSPSGGSPLTDDTTRKLRTWYRLQSEREGLQQQMKPYEDAMNQLRNQQKHIEQEIIQTLQQSKLEQRPLQIGDDFFRVQRESSWTPLTFTWLQQALSVYFGNVNAAQECYNQIRLQRQQSYDYKLSKFSPRTSKKTKGSAHS